MNAYSEDLRTKIVEALNRGMGKSQAARTFSVSPLLHKTLRQEGPGGPLAGAQEEARLETQDRRASQKAA